jgi:hypothetical protein
LDEDHLEQIVAVQAFNRGFGRVTSDGDHINDSGGFALL